MEKVVRLSRDQVAELCPECAEKMRLQRVTELKLHIVDPSSGQEPKLELFHADGTEVKTFTGFSQGLCKKFGEDEGFFTRCAETMTGKVEDEKGFCASLHKFCIGSWPAEKKHEQEFDRIALMENTNSIKGVEIFSPGEHNGDRYTEVDIDDIIAASRELDFRPAIKVGHSKDKPGAPAYGYVENLRKENGKLYADLTDMHDSVVEAVRSKAYDRLSSEIYFNLKRAAKNGVQKVFRRALKAVALLGAEVPAVANLVPLHKMEFAEAGFERMTVFEQDLDVSTETIMETLSERVGSLINLMKESDMAKNAEQIKALKEQVTEFKSKMDEMMKKKGKMKPEDMEDDEEYKQLVAQAQEISDRIATLETKDAEDDEDTEDTDELREELERTKAKLVQSDTNHKALSEKVDRLERERRNTEVGEKVKACKIPAFRPSLEAVYAYALENAAAKIKIFSKKDGKDTSEDKTLVEVLDGWVSEINAQSEKLFQALAATGARARDDGSIEDEAGKEVQRRVIEHRQKNPTVKTYEQAMKVVLSADPDLKQRYEDEMSQAH